MRRVLRWFFAEGPGAVVALAAGIVALVFTLFPDIKPFSATELSARVEILRVERAVTRDQWRWRVAVGDRERYAELMRADEEAAGGGPGEACEALGALPGSIVYVYTAAEGFKRHELTVRAALYEVATRRRIPDPENYRALARVPIDAPTAASVQEIWLYDPGQPRRYFARVALYDSEDHLLHIADSGPFTRITDRELAGLPHDCTATF